MKQVRICFDSRARAGTLAVRNGSLISHKAEGGTELYPGADGLDYCCSSSCGIRLSVEEGAEPGINGTFISLFDPQFPFGFRLSDVDGAFPILIPAYGAAVTAGDDPRCYDEIVASVAARGLISERQEITLAPDESYSKAAAKNVTLNSPAWLGLGRDARIFSLNFKQDEYSPAFKITPRISGCTVQRYPSRNERDGGYIYDETRHASSYACPAPQPDDILLDYTFLTGRGTGPRKNYSKHLLRGYLPVYVTTMQDKDITYTTTSFVSLERSPLRRDTVSGTDYLRAEQFCSSSNFTEAEMDILRQRGEAPQEEAVLYTRIECRNSSSVPRYAWVTLPEPAAWKPSPARKDLDTYGYADGLGYFSQTGEIYCCAKTDGKSICQSEDSYLIPPGETRVIDFALPFSPVSRERGAALLAQDFDLRLDECAEYWEAFLREGAEISVPEPVICDMIKAGRIHIEISTFGSADSDILTTFIGWYSSLPSESWPIIQYYDSMGYPETAEKTIRYYFRKQHDDGRMQCFHRHSMDNGPVLWLVAEHFRYTKDRAFLEEILPGVKKSVEFLFRWRNKNKREELRGRGYGLMDGQASDTPDDDRRMYLLNCFQFKGLDEICTVLRDTEPEYWSEVRREIEAYRGDLIQSLKETFARGIAVPLGDGTWCPASAPWAGETGPISLHPDAMRCISHNYVNIRDSHLPMYIFCGILDRNDPFSEFIRDYTTELFFTDNVRFSQPYWGKQNYLSLQKRERRLFLSTFYNELTSLADRDIYSFWEHYYQVSEHKTAEEGVFLMESRWMLYFEDGGTLSLLRGIPEDWLRDGAAISVEGAACHFGSLSFKATSHIAQNYIDAEIRLDPVRRPDRLELCIPQLERRSPLAVEGGTFDPDARCVVIPVNSDSATIKILL